MHKSGKFLQIASILPARRLGKSSLNITAGENAKNFCVSDDSLSTASLYSFLYFIVELWCEFV